MTELRFFINKWYQTHNARANFILFKKLQENLTWWNEIKSYTSFLPETSEHKQRIYHYINEILEIPKCVVCGNELNFDIYTHPYSSFCSRSCQTKSLHQQNKYDYDKRGKIFKEKYGVGTEGGEILKELKKETSLKNYGVKHPMQSDVVKEKYIKNSLEKYGVDWCSKSDDVKEKVSVGWKNNPDKKSIDEKRAINHKIAMQEKYGVDSAFSLTSVQEKSFRSAFKVKSYICPNGKIIKTQGYGNRFLDFIFKNNIVNENSILSEFDFDRIIYNNSTYRPDFKILFDEVSNCIIEIKSIYIWNSEVEKNLLKIDATEELYDFILIIYGKKCNYFYSKINNVIVEQLKKDGFEELKELKILPL